MPQKQAPADPKTKIVQIKHLIEEQEKATAQLKAQLDEVDQLL